jgi:hypothetical protein
MAVWVQGCVTFSGGKLESDSTHVIARMRQDISYLASPELGGRPPGSAYEDKAAEYIVGRFKEMRMKAIRHEFDVPQAANQILHCTNLVAYKDFGADSTILVSAHYDHLGSDASKSLEIRSKGIHPGADDNASGVAMMLELARVASQKKKGIYNYLFVALSAHEIGLFGSKDLVNQPAMKAMKFKQCVNLDMVGRLDPKSKTIRFSYCTTFPELKSSMHSGKMADLYVLEDASQSTINDFTEFCEAGWPAVSITTGLHDDYHRMGDVESKINYQGMVSVLGFCRAMIGL